MQLSATADKNSHIGGVAQHDLDGCLSGDKLSWERFMETYDRVIRRAVQWTLKSRAEKFAAASEVDDVVQEVYYRLIRGTYKLLRTYDSKRSSLTTWLCVVSRSAALDHMRNQRYMPHCDIDDLDLAAPAELQEDGYLSLPNNVLTPRQIYVLHLSFDKDLPTSDIAALMDVHPQTVRSLRNSAIIRLRDYYARGEVH